MIENADTFMTDQPTNQPKDRHERLQITPWLKLHKNALNFLSPLQVNFPFASLELVQSHRSHLFCLFHFQKQIITLQC